MPDKQETDQPQVQAPPPPYPGPPTSSAPAPGVKFDPEAAPDGMEGFDDKAIRRNFMRKVYSILMIQLVLTGGIISCFLFIDSLKTYVRGEGRWVYYTSLAVSIVCIISLACCSDVRRKFPVNFFFLGLFTVCEGFMLGTISSYYDVDAVLIAVGITAAVTLALTIFALQTKIDFTVCGGILFAVLIVFIIATFLFCFLPKSKWTMIGIGIAGSLIFSCYLVYDTQLMMGGNHAYSLSPEEYIFASLNIYLDIVNLFLYILLIFAGGRD